MRRVFFAALLGVFLASSTPIQALAGPLENGLAALDRKDYQTAFSLLEPLAQEGERAAQYIVAFLYSRGLGVSKSENEALSWCRLSAGQGNPFAQTSLGLLYSNGQGVKRNYVEAVKWYRLAAESGLRPREQSVSIS